MTLYNNEKSISSIIKTSYNYIGTSLYIVKFHYCSNTFENSCGLFPNLGRLKIVYNRTLRIIR